MKSNTIYNQDCVGGMLSMPAGSVDIVVTSPPYNLDIKYGKYKVNLNDKIYMVSKIDRFIFFELYVQEGKYEEQENIKVIRSR